ncbi:MAG: hypothetical protein IJV65_09165 [Kiritimatiellae bacterium]|nr:hypothetical protein [Kiritimatiellia bacterium]
MNAFRRHLPSARAAAPVLLAAAALAVFAAIGPRLRAARRARRGPVPAAAARRAADDRASALVEFASVALGGFRGVLADALWLRAGRMQEERRFVELVQLADWVAELEPHNDEVWIFHAWNMAYNVSFLLSRPDDRWRWVGNGIALLRDRGIPLNPRSAALKQALGWFFQHKIGMDMDEAAPFYRAAWAAEIGPYLGEDGAAPAEGSFAEEELGEAFGMDASQMRLLEKRFGPVDWRVPDASSLYWGWLGAEDAADGGRDSLSCRRMVYQSLMQMARGAGRLVPAPEGSDAPFAAVPAPHLAAGAMDYTEALMRRSSFAGIRHAYVYFVRDMVGLALLQGRVEDARAFYARLEAFFGGFGLAGELPAFEDLPDADPEVFGALLSKAGFD